MSATPTPARPAAAASRTARSAARALDGVGVGVRLAPLWAGCAGAGGVPPSSGGRSGVLVGASVCCGRSGVLPSRRAGASPCGGRVVRATSF